MSNMHKYIILADNIDVWVSHINYEIIFVFLVFFKFKYKINIKISHTVCIKCITKNIK